MQPNQWAQILPFTGIRWGIRTRPLHIDAKLSLQGVDGGHGNDIFGNEGPEYASALGPLTLQKSITVLIWKGLDKPFHTNNPNQA